MDIKLIKLACPIISKSLVSIVDLSFVNHNDIVHGGWEKVRLTPVYTYEGEINDEYNFRSILVISHIDKMAESLVSTGLSTI